MYVAVSFVCSLGEFELKSMSVLQITDLPSTAREVHEYFLDFYGEPNAEKTGPSEFTYENGIVIELEAVADISEGEMEMIRKKTGFPLCDARTDSRR